MTRGDPTQWVAGPPKREATGFTLIEVVLSVTILSILMGAMMSAILISRQAIDDGDSLISRTVAGREAVDEITSDLQLALTITESTATAVTFTVPDRTGDDAAETIRYAWSGIAGDPLTRTFNGTTVDLTQNVHNLDFTYLTRTIKAASNKLLLVVGNSSTLPSDDQARQTQFESWGYTVTVIDDGTSQSEMDTAVGENDVVYISETIDSSILGTKLTNAAIGIVSGEGNLQDDLGFASTVAWTSDNDINVTDNSHDITSPFSTGSLVIYSTTSSINNPYGTLAGGAQVLARDYSYNDPVLIAIESGGALYGGGNAAGRRVLLPWCVTDVNDFSILTADALTITKRSLEWALGSEPAVGGSGFSFGVETVGASSHDSVTSRIRCTQATLSEDATITDIVGYIQGPIGSQVRFAIYTDSSGEPGTKIVETALDSLSVSTAHWHTISIAPTALTAGTYWLAIGFSHTNMYYFYSSGGKTRHKFADTPTLPATWGTSDYLPSWTISIYGVKAAE